jgi:predicted 2-oxoglutarate/Fe(II)-dependent dioxygenase YbiX/peroxiredoxin
MRSAPLTVGEPAPWFVAPVTSRSRFCFETTAGRYVVLCFLESAARPASQRILEDIQRYRDRFNDAEVCFFGVTVDPDDQRLGRVRDQVPGLRFFLDFDRRVSHLFGAVASDASERGPAGSYQPHTLILDTRLRVLSVLPFESDPAGHVPRILEALAQLPPFGPEGPAAMQAPVLVVPRIFEPELCRILMRYYDERGGGDSGFMRELGGKTVGVMDYGFKRRRDQDITDEALRRECMVRIHDRLVPEIQKAFQFRATRIERYIVACYDSTTGGFFRPHRDDNTKGTAHRRFAVSLNLNTGEFEGGNLRFAEFGRQTYCPPAGGAVVFSCSLLHEATPVTRGKRYAFLPFLYDEAAAQIRRQNIHLVETGAALPAPSPA